MVEIRFIYGENPIKTVAVECPACEGWFKDKDIIPLWRCYSASTSKAVMNLGCKCPQCKYEFVPAEEGHVSREYDTEDEVYEGTLHREEHWER